MVRRTAARCLCYYNIISNNDVDQNPVLLEMTMGMMILKIRVKTIILHPMNQGFLQKRTSLG